MPKLITTFIPNGLGIFAVSDSSLSFKTVTSATGVETASLSSTGAFTATSFTGSGAGLSAGTTPLTTLDIDGATDIGADIVDADLFIVDDGAGGTNRKVTASRLKAYMPGPDPVSADGDSLGTASLEWSDLYLADGGVIYFGNDQDINLTHVADTGLTTNGDFSVGDDLKLTSDAAVLGFGADNDVTLTHVADTALQVNKDVHAESFNLPITLNGTDGSSTHAGDNIILDASAAGTDVGERLLYEGDPPDIPSNISDDISVVNDATLSVDSGGTLSVKTGATAKFYDQSMPTDGGLWTGRNLIINGEMKVAQRGTTFAPLANGVYGLDRWLYYDIGAHVATVTQDTDVPNGNFKHSMKVDVTTADASVAAGDMAELVQKIEGLNMSSLGWGTEQAKDVTISFWVKSPKTGIHGIAVQNSGQDRAYADSYTIATADTWEHHSVTIKGDTQGTWLTTTGIGMSVGFPLMLGTDWTQTAGAWGTSNKWGVTGQVNCVDNTANNFYLTGVQLEVGTSYTPFEHELISTTLQKCFRYYQIASGGEVSGNWRNTTTCDLSWPLKVEMRASPTVALADNSPVVVEPGVASRTGSSSSLGSHEINSRGATFSIDGFSSTTAQNFAALINAGTTALTAAAEL